MQSGICVSQNVDPLGVRGHETVLDSVMHHLHEVAGSGRPQWR
jgi:hypothetical protein